MEKEPLAPYWDGYYAAQAVRWAQPELTGPAFQWAVAHYNHDRSVRTDREPGGKSWLEGIIAGLNDLDNA